MSLSITASHTSEELSDPSEIVVDVDTAEVFDPLLEPARYKGAWGGRGSGKSHFFAGLLVEHCHRFPGTRAVCVREIQKTLRDSSKAVIEDKIKSLGVDADFDIRATVSTQGETA